jgi:hypothetical protein
LNYLQLVNAVREKCSANGAALTTVVSQTGEALRYVNWVNDAWMDIQGMYENWEFMRTTFSFATVSHQQSYTPTQAGTTNFANWKRDSIRIYQTSLGYPNEIWMPFQDYESFRNLYQFGAMRTSYQRPVVFSIDPAKNFLLGPGPNATGYTVGGEYYTVPLEMALDADTPSLPVEYHKAIVFRAMMFYGAYEAAGEIYTEGQSEFKTIIARAEINQLPLIDLGGPML